MEAQGFIELGLGGWSLVSEDQKGLGTPHEPQTKQDRANINCLGKVEVLGQQFRVQQTKIKMRRQLSAD